MTLAEYLALNPTGNVAQYLDTKDQRVLRQGVGGGARPNFSRAIPLQQDQRFIDNVNAMPKNPPPMVPVPPASNFPRENVVPRVANQNDNPFTGGLTQNGMPLNEMTGRVIPGGEYPIPRPPQPITNQLPPSPMPRGAGVDQAIMANRQQQQQRPNTNIFGMPQGGDQGRFGMSGFFGRLFNDPNRMAMLSSGLTALDPNSYYDKEGFGSPWTGLRAGLGAGREGYKSVIDRRKALAETEKLKAEAGAEGMGKDPNDWKLYQKALKSGFKGEFQDWLDRKWGRQSGVQGPMAGAMKDIYQRQGRFLIEAQPEAEQAVLGLRNLYESKRFLDEGAITGTGAEYITGFHNLLKSRFGFNTGSDVDNTQAFAASMGNQVGQIIKQFGAGTGLSDADREYAEKIVGGKITLTEGAIRELMRIQEKMYRYKIKNYRKKSVPFIKGMETAGVYQGMDLSISTEGLDLESETDWGKKVGKYYDPRRAAMGNYYYKRDAEGKITDKKKYRTPQSNPSGVGKAVLKPLNETERNRLEELEKKFGNG